MKREISSIPLLCYRYKFNTEEVACILLCNSMRTCIGRSVPGSFCTLTCLNAKNGDFCLQMGHVTLLLSMPGWFFTESCAPQ